MLNRSLRYSEICSVTRQFTLTFVQSFSNLHWRMLSHSPIYTDVSSVTLQFTMKFVQSLSNLHCRLFSFSPIYTDICSVTPQFTLTFVQSLSNLHWWCRYRSWPEVDPMTSLDHRVKVREVIVQVIHLALQCLAVLCFAMQCPAL